MCHNLSMVIVTVGNSMSRIEGLTASQFSKLRKLLSYQSNPQAVYFSGGFNRLKYLLDKKGYFPTGLYNKVLWWVKQENLIHNCKDARIKPRPNIKFIIKL